MNILKAGMKAIIVNELFMKRKDNRRATLKAHDHEIQEMQKNIEETQQLLADASSKASTSLNLPIMEK